MAVTEFKPRKSTEPLKRMDSSVVKFGRRDPSISLITWGYSPLSRGCINHPTVNCMALSDASRSAVELLSGSYHLNHMTIPISPCWLPYTYIYIYIYIKERQVLWRLLGLIQCYCSYGCPNVCHIINIICLSTNIMLSLHIVSSEH